MAPGRGVRSGVGLIQFHAMAFAGLAADRMAHLPVWARLTLLCAGAAGAIGIFIWPLRQMGRAIDWVEVASAIENRTDCFGQRLVTITSQLLDEPGHRGSDQILKHLVQQVDEQATIQRSRRPLPIPGAMRPWALSAGAVLVVIGLIRVPVLGMPQLLIRFIEPTVPIGPVTTTSLRVSPGDCDVPVSEPLRVEVEAHRLANDTVWLHHSDDGAIGFAPQWNRPPAVDTSSPLLPSSAMFITSSRPAMRQVPFTSRTLSVRRQLLSSAFDTLIRRIPDARRSRFPMAMA